MSDKQYCPRSIENGGGPGSPFHSPFNGEMTWGEHDNTCSYCGSMHPDEFMARLEAGNIQVGPTDKSYKVYVRPHGEGAPLFKQTARNCPISERCPGPDQCTHWETRETNHSKFYFQHLSVEQRQRFIDLYNEKKMHLGVPGHFYVTPYFCAR